MERILLTTGGTGGHIFPALAVAEALRRTHPSVRLLFMGSLYGPEKDLVSKAGIDFVGLPVRGFLGRGFKSIGAGVRMVQAMYQACGIVRKFQPQAAVGFGGYAAFAPLVAAHLCRVPTLLHEQNAIAGVSNRILGRFARCICVSLPETRGFAPGFAPGRRVYTGNPVRADVVQVGCSPHTFDNKRLLVMGGSLGSHALNKALMKSLPRLYTAGVAVQIQTGLADAETVRTACVQAGYADSCVTPFIDTMARAYAWADLVLCRAGATTVAELCAAGRPAVFVPFPYATHNHQTFNALSLVQDGAAQCVPEKELHTIDLPALLCHLLNDTPTLQRMAKKALQRARPHAADAVVAQIQTLIER